MSSFAEKVVQKLGKCIPESDVQTFKTLSVKCLREGGPAGLQRLKDQLKTLPEHPSEDVLKEIEDIFNDHTINTLSFVFQNKQAAAIAGVLTKMADRVYLDEQISSDQKAKVMEGTRKLLSKLESCSKEHMADEVINEIIQHTEEVKEVVEGSEATMEVTCDLAETVKELVAAQAE